MYSPSFMNYLEQKLKNIQFKYLHTLRIFNNFLVRNEQYGIHSLPLFLTLNVCDRISFSTDNMMDKFCFSLPFYRTKANKGKLQQKKIKR